MGGGRGYSRRLVDACNVAAIITQGVLPEINPRHGEEPVILLSPSVRYSSNCTAPAGDLGGMGGCVVRCGEGSGYGLRDKAGGGWAGCVGGVGLDGWDLRRRLPAGVQRAEEGGRSPEPSPCPCLPCLLRLQKRWRVWFFFNFFSFNFLLGFIDACALQRPTLRETALSIVEGKCKGSPVNPADVPSEPARLCLSEANFHVAISL